MGHQAEGAPVLSQEAETADQLALPAGLVAVFALERILGEDAVGTWPTEAYVEQTYRVNMPSLLLQSEVGKGLALRPAARTRIDERAKGLVVIPCAQDRPFTDGTLRLFEGYLDGMAAGKSIAEVAQDIDIPDRTLKRRIALMREYLGVTSEASIVYSALLHGYKPRLTLPDDWTEPELTPNEELHLYLAALGFQKLEVVDLIGVKPATVHQHRMRGLGKFKAKSTTQALARGFYSGNLVTLADYEAA